MIILTDPERDQFGERENPLDYSVKLHLQKPTEKLAIDQATTWWIAQPQNAISNIFGVVSRVAAADTELATYTMKAANLVGIRRVLTDFSGTYIRLAGELIDRGIYPNTTSPVYAHYANALTAQNMAGIIAVHLSVLEDKPEMLPENLAFDDFIKSNP